MDIQLYDQERGSGFPLILLHGNGEDHTYFKHQISCFSPFYRVIAIDTRGHGKSPRGTAPFTLHRFVEELHDFMVERDIPKAHLLGFSDGGNIALLFALKYPEFVERLVLNGANLNPRGMKLTVRLPVNWEYRLASLFSPWSETAGRKKELFGLMAKEPQILPEELKLLTMPVLVVAGNRDMIRDKHTRAIAAALSNSVLRILEGDHFIAAKSPGIFNRVVVDFLNGGGGDDDER